MKLKSKYQARQAGGEEQKMQAHVEKGGKPVRAAAAGRARSRTPHGWHSSIRSRSRYHNFDGIGVCNQTPHRHETTRERTLLAHIGSG